MHKQVYKIRICINVRHHVIRNKHCLLVNFESPVKYKKFTHFTYKKKSKCRQQIVIENSKKMKSGFNPRVYEKRDDFFFPYS